MVSDLIGCKGEASSHTDLIAPKGSEREKSSPLPTHVFDLYTRVKSSLSTSSVRRQMVVSTKFRIRSESPSDP
jgi:hypothetical protein